MRQSKRKSWKRLFDITRRRFVPSMLDLSNKYDDRVLLTSFMVLSDILVAQGHPVEHLQGLVAHSLLVDGDVILVKTK